MLSPIISNETAVYLRKNRTHRPSIYLLKDIDHIDSPFSTTKLVLYFLGAIFLTAAIFIMCFTFKIQGSRLVMRESVRNLLGLDKEIREVSTHEPCPQQSNSKDAAADEFTEISVVNE